MSWNPVIFAGNLGFRVGVSGFAGKPKQSQCQLVKDSSLRRRIDQERLVKYTFPVKHPSCESRLRSYLRAFGVLVELQGSGCPKA